MTPDVCPCCGAKANAMKAEARDSFFGDFRRVFFVACSGCGLRTSNCETSAASVMLWNARVPRLRRA